MNFTQEMYAAWCAKYEIDVTDESQKPGIEGSLTDLAEGRGELPEWMTTEPVFESLVAARAAAMQPVEGATAAIEEGGTTVPEAAPEAAPAEEAPVEEAAPEAAVAEEPVA